MKIALVTPLFPLSNDCDSGIAMHYQHLANGLIKLGHEVIIYFFPYEVFESKVYNQGELTIYQVGCSLPQLFFLKGIGRLLKSFKFLEWYPTFLFQKQICDFLKKRVIEDKIEIIESTSNRGLLARYSKSKDRPPICTRVSTTMESAFRNAKIPISINYKIEAKFEHKQILRSESLVTHSKCHSIELENELGLSNLLFKIIPHGITIDKKHISISESKNINILFVGRLERRKGIEVLLKAIPLVLKSNEHISFSIIGSGSPELASFFSSNLKINKKVSFLGKVPNEQLKEAYQRCDIFVAPSYYESFGLIFAEAMAFGKPVIGTNVGGIPDVVEHNQTGILIEPGDQNELARAILRLADSTELRSSMGNAGRKRVKEMFSIPKMASRSVKHYEDVLSGKKY